MASPIIIGITGGSGSGKSWLAQAVRQSLGHDRVAIVAQDGYYRDLSHLDRDVAAQTNFDHPDALELDRLEDDVFRLANGEAVTVPQYAFSSFSRQTEALPLQPRPLIVVEGLFALLPPRLRQAYDLSVFVDTPSDLRLIRRIRRDTSERGYDLERILDFWESRALPMFEQHVKPQREQADLVWRSLEDKAFVPNFLADLDSRLARNADKSQAAR